MRTPADLIARQWEVIIIQRKFASVRNIVVLIPGYCGLLLSGYAALNPMPVSLPGLAKGHSRERDY